jgi:molecular chaperone DnaK
MVVLGIDLGTSRSAAAAMINGKIQLVSSSETNSNDAKPFHSVVSFFEDGGCLIGKQALEQSSYNPKGTVFNVKRLIGSGETVHALKKSYLPQFISALLIMEMKIKAEKLFNQTITRAVITVPAYFNDNQRQATRDAGKIAGLNVIQVLNEPVAASIAYGLNRLENPTKILVFDMGAGTLDVSILEVDKNFFEVLCTTGDTNLGGINIDEIISEFLLAEIKKIKPNEPIDELSKLQIMQLAESIKIRLSEENTLDFVEDVALTETHVDLPILITREKFDSMIEPILEKSKACISDALKGARLSSDKIDKVILVGGPVKIPAIRKMVSYFIREPESDIDSTFTVASGAAIQGAVLSDDRNLPVTYQNLILLNKTPLDLGERAKEKGVDFIQLMIPKNTTYPTEFTDVFYVNKPMQTEVSVSIWQGDFVKNPGFPGNVNIGQFWLRGLQAGMGNEIEVTYRVDADGIISVTAYEIGGNAHDELVIDKMGNSVIPPPELEFAHEEIEKIEKKHRRDTMSPYEIPVEDYEFASPKISAEYSKDYGWVCDSLTKAIDVIKTHHNHPEYHPDFFDTARFEIYLQLDMQYAYAYIQLTGGPVYPIHIHNALKEKSEQNKKIMVVTLVHELLHAIHPDWGHNKIRPAERRLANLAMYFDAYKEMEIKFLSGKMSLCNNSMTRRDQKVRIQC